MDQGTREIMTKMSILDHLYRYPDYKDRLRLLKELHKEMKEVWEKDLKTTT